MLLHCYFSLEDHELIWKHMDWLMEKDEELGVRVSHTCIPLSSHLFCKSQLSQGYLHIPHTLPHLRLFVF